LNVTKKQLQAAQKTASNRIKEALAEKGKTQVWLAGQLDVEFLTVTRYANNVRQPSLEVLYDIADVLGVDPCDLLVRRKAKK
jgi:putative transcriptional regulator